MGPRTRRGTDGTGNGLTIGAVSAEDHRDGHGGAPYVFGTAFELI